MNFKFLLAIVLPFANALPWDGPQVTATAELGSFELFRHDQIGIAAKHGWNPVPTAKPRDLEKRVSSAFLTASTIADTCGYLEGSAGFPQTCDQGYTCAIATAQNVWACCPTPSACQIATTCVPQSALVSCAGNPGCQGDNYATKCDTFDPYCNQQIIIGEGNLPATLFYCDSIPSIETVYATATDAGTTASPASFVFVKMTIASISVSTTPTPTSSSAPSSTPVTFTSTSSSAPSPAHTSKPTPVGAIVGGTIGGIAVLCALAFGIFFLLRSKKKNNEAPASDMQQTQYPPQPAPDAGQGTAGYPSPQSGGKNYYSAQGSPVSPYSPPQSPPLGPPAPQYQPSYNYQGPSEVEGTAVHR